MKLTFTTIDVRSILAELQESVLHLRVNQIYDVDSKTYLIKLQKPNVKKVLLFESGARVHTTDYEWPKSPAPSGFSMKLRKHLKNKRIEKIEQLGIDRVLDLTFGNGEAANHLIIELYDRGNVVLTDFEYTILNVLRQRTDEEAKNRIATHEKYLIDNARQAKVVPDIESLIEIVSKAKQNTALKKVFNPLLDCGSGVLENELLMIGLPAGAKIGKDFKVGDSLEAIHGALVKAQQLVTSEFSAVNQKGYIIKKIESRSKGDGTSEEVHIFQEFHPRLYKQHSELPFDEFTSFSQACDEFFSKIESIKIDQKAMQQERDALKKLENVKKDHEKRLQALLERQEEETHKGQLIELNQQLVEGALLVVRSAIANQIDWTQIKEIIDEAQARGDPVASSIRNLKLETNMITLLLSDPYDYEEDDLLLDSDEERQEGNESSKLRPVSVDIDLDLSALANARKYYNMKRQAAKKEQKTIDASKKAMKSAEKKTQQALKEVAATTNINKVRKVHWFEKFLWFVSSENYLAIAGRDSQQNEIVVKKHLKPKDIYVHADLHGAASVIIKNPSTEAVPPRTLHEAGIMALCYSRAWDEKVVTSAWWVWGDQVSKTAPSGEYLTTGSFMVRGKKNFLPPSHLVYGFGFLFRLEEGSVARHLGERKVRNLDCETSAVITAALDQLNMNEKNNLEDQELVLEDEDDDDENSERNLSQIEENKELEKNENEKNELKKEENEEDLSDVKSITEENEDESRASDNDKSYDGDDEGKDTEEFPDTEVKITHSHGDQFRLSINDQQNQETKEDKLLNAYKEKQSQGKKKQKNQNPTNANKEPNEKVKEIKEESSTNQLKRGQKGKLKKLRKYRDQDEEERELRMQLLQSSGTSKEKKKGKDKKGKGNFPKMKNPLPPRPPNEDNKPKENAKKPNSVEVDQDDEDEEANLALDDMNVLNCLTHLPVTEDELLYAVPICAPYSSMNNYKFKVKLTPGPGKKGKACKTAVSLFLSDKNSSPREKDLLRAVRDSDLARNLPGKVKVSAPNISKIRK